jgi:hypothetical protein
MPQIFAVFALTRSGKCDSIIKVWSYIFEILTSIAHFCFTEVRRNEKGIILAFGFFIVFFLMWLRQGIC